MKLAKKETQAAPAPVEKKRLKQSSGAPVGMKVIVLSAIGILLTIAVSVGIAVDQLYEPTLVTVNGDKYQLSDLKYQVFMQEYQAYQTESIYQNYMGTSYLDQVVDEATGETNLDQAKAMTMETIIEAEVLYKEAVKNGYSVTEEDKTAAEKVIADMETNLGSDFLKSNGFTDSYLKNILQKLELVTRFQQDTIDGFDIDDAAIEEGINYEDYHQYEIGVFEAKKTKEVTSEEEGAESETVELSEKELKEVYDKLAALKDSVASAEDLTTVLGEDEETITYTSETIEADNTTYKKKDVKKIIRLENGEVLDIIETDDAYYLIKMINNKATESYDQAVSSAIEGEENTKFEEYYENLEKEYTITQNEEAWEDVNFGYVTMNAYAVQ